MHIFARDRLLRYGLVLAGAYGAYALGANNVADVTGVYIETGQLTVFQAALPGVPVSSSQAIIGAVLGIGLLKGVQTISKKTLLSILSGWIASPAVAGIFAYTIYGLAY